MFFRNAKQVASTVKNATKIYLQVSGYGAGIGGGVGLFCGVISSPFIFGDEIPYSDKKTSLGRFVYTIENTTKYIAASTATGMLIGGAPVTYPIAKAIDKYHERKSMRP